MAGALKRASFLWNSPWNARLARRRRVEAFKQMLTTSCHQIARILLAWFGQA